MGNNNNIPPWSDGIENEDSFMENEDNEILPSWYYETLVEYGKDNLCAGMIVQGHGKILPEVIVTPTSYNKITTYKLETSTAGILSQGSGSKTVVLFILERKWKSIYHHHMVATTVRQKPSIITLDNDPIKAAIRRKQSISWYPTLPGFDRDEYPYATTFEGGFYNGTNASVMYVPYGENRSHGNYVKTIKNAYKMTTGDKFQIVLIPDNLEQNPEPLPKPVLDLLPQNKPSPYPIFYELEKQPVHIPFPSAQPVKPEDVAVATGFAALMMSILKSLDIVVSRTIMPIFIMPPLYDQNYMNYPQQREIY